MSAIATSHHESSAQLSPTVSYYLRKLLREQTTASTIPPTVDLNGLLRQAYGLSQEFTTALDDLERLVRYHQALTSQSAQHPDELEKTEREILRILESPRANLALPQRNSTLIRIRERGTAPDELHLLLAQRGYRVEYLRRGRTTLSQAKDLDPDAVLIELDRPQQGLELCQVITRDRHLQWIPLLMMSSFHSVSDRVKAFKLGVTDYITQPVQAEEVLARLENQLQLQHHRKQLEQNNRALQVQLQQHNGGDQISSLLAQEVVNGSGDYVLYINRENGIVYGNSAAVRTLGYEPNQLEGLSIGEIDPHLAPEDWQTIWKHLQQHHSLTLKSVHRSQEGHFLEVHLALKYVALHGQSYCCIIAQRS